MRFLLALMAMTLFAISTGCDKPEETKAASGDAAATAAPVTPEVPAAPAGETQTVSLKLPGMT
ncbi:MAG: hypothetical protein P8J27_14950 [Mariniblastus sp.]|nr:hypothetical protein [Mariniblastus sp.]